MTRIPNELIQVRTSQGSAMDQDNDRLPQERDVFKRDSQCESWDSQCRRKANGVIMSFDGDACVLGVACVPLE